MKKYSDYIINQINTMSDEEFENILNRSGISSCPILKSDSNYVSSYQFIYSSAQIKQTKTEKVAFEVTYEAVDDLTCYDTNIIANSGINLDDTSKAA